MATPVQVYVRVRDPSLSAPPTFDAAHAAPLPPSDDAAVTVTDASTLVFRAPPTSVVSGTKSFKFSGGFGPGATNDDVFARVAGDVLSAATSGVNASIFAYGSTGTGKTHTMLGTDADEGVTQRVLRGLLSPQTASSADETIVTLSHYEIYNEKVYDLLSQSATSTTTTGAAAATQPDLRVREHKERGPFVEGLTTVRVETVDEALDVLRRGVAARSVGETRVNGRSSRSHAVFQIEVQVRRHRYGEDDVPAMLTSKISLVDLAGSERTAKTNATGARLREANSINTSLMTLGLVINSLTANAASSSTPTPTDASNNNTSDAASETSSSAPQTQLNHVPYRNSSLTWLLRDSLGGNAKTAMLATVSCLARDAEETLSTLRYADRAKCIVNHAHVNEDGTSVLIKALRKEIDLLRSKIARYEGPPAADEPPHKQHRAPAAASSSSSSSSGFSTDAALAMLKTEKPTPEAALLERVRVAEERAERAERDSKERAELLWSSAQALNLQMEEAIRLAREETQAALDRQEQEEVLPLVEEASALRIQCAWQRFLHRRVARPCATSKRKWRTSSARTLRSRFSR